MKSHENRNMKTDFQVFAKPAGDSCNMACPYCYYTSCNPEFVKTLPMSDDMLENYISQHIRSHLGPIVRFSWHGGEPTLLGVDFFKRVVFFQKKYQRRGIQIQNGIQTNGTLLNEEWCSFFKHEGFTVGLSLDGPEHLHDRYRRSKSGRGTHVQVMKAQHLLEKNKVPYDILCVVYDHNVDHPLDVYRFFRKIGASYIGFLPVVGSLPEDSVDPYKYGTFLCSVFDEWKARDIGSIKVQIFEEVANTALGQEHALCIFRKSCGDIPVVEKNGDMYPCDHYVRPGFKLGNLNDAIFVRLLKCKRMNEFGRMKLNGLAVQCKTCTLLAFCNGGCPKDRIIPISGSDKKLNHLCSGYRLFFNHCLPFVEQLKLQSHKEKEEKPVKTGRNSPCPCGSGKKFKKCCMIQ